MTLAAVNIQINTEFNSIMQKWPPYGNIITHVALLLGSKFKRIF